MRTATACFAAMWLALEAAGGQARPQPAPREILLEARSQLSSVTERSEHAGNARTIAQWLAWARFYDDAIETVRIDTMFAPLQFKDLARIRAANGDVAGATSMVEATLTGAGAARARSAIAADLAERGDAPQGARVALGLTGRAQHDVLLATAERLITDGKLVQAESTITAAATSGAYVDDIRVHLAEAYVRQGNEKDAARGSRGREPC